MKKNFKNSTAVKEIKYLLPFYAVTAGIISLISVIIIIATGGHYDLLWGGLIGSAVSYGNFILMAVSAEKSVSYSEKQAKLLMNGGYAVRYIAMFLVLGFLMYFGTANPLTAILPLFVPKIAYTVQAIKKPDDMF